MIRINQLKVPIDKNRTGAIKKALSKKYNVPISDIKKIYLKKLSIDARDKSKIKWVCNIDIDTENKKLIAHKDANKILDKEYNTPKFGEDRLINRPVIVGFGPAGMFAALILSEYGYRPIILERGEDVDSRTKTVDKFWKEAILNEESNVQFGEGGAGTFSDGKLTSRGKDIRSKKVLEYFVECGAPAEILYMNKPHIGTDILKRVVFNIRKRIIQNGGEIRFNTKMTDIDIQNGKLVSIKDQNQNQILVENLILAIGHSARDTFELLNKKAVNIAPKPFAVGVRIEHLQELIDKSQYGSLENREILGASDYALTHQASNGRSVYTFCMCPGGEVVAASSEKGHLVTNGMSEYRRDKKNANSAVLVNVLPSDFGSDDLLAGVHFQRELEKKAFMVSKDYKAPIMYVSEFLEKGEKFNSSKNDKKINYKVKPSYSLGTVKADFKRIFPPFIIEAMQEGIIAFGNKIKGFDMDGAVMTAVETRTSSPIRILRDRESLQSENVSGLYPCGEGAGYAGGIISSAVDGIKCAEKIMEKYFPMGEL